MPATGATQNQITRASWLRQADRHQGERAGLGALALDPVGQIAGLDSVAGAVSRLALPALTPGADLFMPVIPLRLLWGGMLFGTDD